MNVVRLSSLRTRCLYTHRKYSWYSFLVKAELTPEPEYGGGIMSLENSIDAIGNRTGDLPACSAVPQPNAPPCAPITPLVGSLHLFFFNSGMNLTLVCYFLTTLILNLRNFKLFFSLSYLIYKFIQISCL